jgi:transcriptional regulator with XRE-family HTH domain
MNPAVKCLRDATTAKGWTLADLAFVIGCPPARLSAWLHPHHLISPQQARIFEAALSVDPYHLLIDLQIPWQMSLPSVERARKIGDCPTCHRPIFEPLKQRKQSPQDEGQA